MAEDLDLEAELLADSNPRPRGCMVCNWLESRDDADKWNAAFRNERITMAALLRGMQARGYTGQQHPVKFHRERQHGG